MTRKRPALNRAQIQEIERRAVEQCGLSWAVLMENAGRGTADVLRRLRIDGPVVVCCGKGNNGGDGYVIARHLESHGHAVSTFLFCDPLQLTGAAAENLSILRHCRVRIDVVDTTYRWARFTKALAAAAWVVDALLGTGASGSPQVPLDRAIRAINDCGRPVLAVDVPSGLDCDTGQPGLPTVRAQHTCTFVAPKPGFLVRGARAYTGKVHTLGIGIPSGVSETLRAE